MPQEFNVLCCYSCIKYQVHPVKKANKWICKVCGNKQSIKKIYLTASSKECRELVQKLNALRGEKQFYEEMMSRQQPGTSSSCNESDIVYEEENTPSQCESSRYISEKHGFSAMNSQYDEWAIGQKRKEETCQPQTRPFMGHKNTNSEEKISVKRQKISHESISISKSPILENFRPFSERQNKENDLKDICTDKSKEQAYDNKAYSPLAAKQNHGFQFIINAASKSKLGNCIKKLDS